MRADQELTFGVALVGIGLADAFVAGRADAAYVRDVQARTAAKQASLAQRQVRLAELRDLLAKLRA